ncbi:hypothetical protein [Moraxella bovis]|uniref:PIN domain-containing protein n=1 Tax=Moraxella bovis TaxID=476 RepID=A0A378PUA4_MORBO|nr:hypothetical protein [Moraxella bovis]STY90322.1 Uncharacterised protein [Moraxella bovis]
MRVYLDNCMFNRPFDNQSNLRVSLETQEKLHIQSLVYQGQLELIWSYILDFENSFNPYMERKLAISKWQKLSVIDIEESQELLAHAHFFQSLGIKSKDTLHVSCAVMGGADCFLTTDDKFLKKLAMQDKIKSCNPLYFLGFLDEN